MTSPPAIHALHGFLGSGKTTLARQLEMELPALRFSSDEWMVPLYGQDPPEALFSEYHSRIYAVMRLYWTRALALGLPVVLDEGLWTRRERDNLRAEAAHLGVPLMLYALSTPGSVARERIRQRNREPNSLYIADNTTSLRIPTICFAHVLSRWTPTSRTSWSEAQSSVQSRLVSTFEINTPFGLIADTVCVQSVIKMKPRYF